MTTASGSSDVRWAGASSRRHSSPSPGSSEPPRPGRRCRRARASNGSSDPTPRTPSCVVFIERRFGLPEDNPELWLGVRRRATLLRPHHRTGAAHVHGEYDDTCPPRWAVATQRALARAGVAQAAAVVRGRPRLQAGVLRGHGPHRAVLRRAAGPEPARQERSRRPSESTGSPTRMMMPSMKGHSAPMPQVTRVTTSWATPTPTSPMYIRPMPKENGVLQSPATSFCFSENGRPDFGSTPYGAPCSVP